MKSSMRHVLLFLGSVIAAVYLHELGHAIAGWTIGIAVVPTPAKEYVLRSELDWNQLIWVSLGGVIGTTVAALAAVLYFLCKPCHKTEAILGGALLPPGLYSLRFLLIGRGHDSTEWQAAQSALGLPPPCHAIDAFFLCLFILGFVIWFFRLHPSIRSLLKIATLAIVGIGLLVMIQVVNNAVFDRAFPIVKTVNVPAGLDPR